jgi:endogenous inhibitor of DNA gyrase (YacG/DUF329 family)
MDLPRCPICEKSFRPEDSPALPFCSERCRQIDLGRWLDQRYGLPYESPTAADAEHPDQLRPER